MNQFMGDAWRRAGMFLFKVSDWLSLQGVKALAKANRHDLKCYMKSKAHIGL